MTAQRIGRPEILVSANTERPSSGPLSSGQKNGGIGKASNAAVRMSRGFFIGQLDSDDYLNPTRVELCSEGASVRSRALRASTRQMRTCTTSTGERHPATTGRFSRGKNSLAQ